MNKGSACGGVIRLRVAKGGPVVFCAAHHFGPDLSKDMLNVGFPSFPAAPTAYPALPDSRSAIHPSDATYTNTCLDWGPQYDVAVERARKDQ